MPPAVQGTGVVGGEGRTGKLLFAQTPTMVGPAWAKPQLAAPPVVKFSAKSPCKGNQNVQTNEQDSTQGARRSSSLQCYRCQGWGHMARECATPVAPLNREGGLWNALGECSQTPLQSCAIKTKHSLHNPEPQPTQKEAGKQMGQKNIEFHSIPESRPGGAIGRMC